MPHDLREVLDIRLARGLCGAATQYAATHSSFAGRRLPWSCAAAASPTSARPIPAFSPAKRARLRESAPILPTPCGNRGDGRPLSGSRQSGFYPWP